MPLVTRYPPGSPGPTGPPGPPGPRGPAGPAGGVQVVTVPVSSAQILDLANTDVALIAGVPGFAVIVNGATILYQAGLVPYLAGGGNLVVGTRQASNPPVVSSAFSAADTGFLDQAVSQIAGTGYGNGIAVFPVASDWDGQDVILYEDNSNPTLGDGTLLVTLSYFLAPTA